MLAIFALLALPLRAEVPVPPLQARVTDLTGTLTREQQAALERKLAAFEQKKGSQLAVLVVPTTRPETIEQYSIRVAEQWKLGRKGVDDGALLLVAKEDRELRIEVGYGLEGVLPDAIAKRIVSEVIVPRLRQGDLYGGIEAGVSRMISVIEGEPLPPPRPRDSGASQTFFNLDSVLTIILVTGMIGAFLRLFLGRLVAGAVTGAGAGLLVWLMASSVVFALIAAVVVFILGLTGVIGPGSRGGRGGGWSGGGWSSGG
ncbi:MAG TPA: YgcG family protein, partial [Burkholderiales bacterium]